MLGSTVGHYLITERIGEGGMGVVYKARDTRLDRTVAIKVLPPDKISDPGRRSRFEQEARTASALNHPNIVTIYDIVRDGATDCLVMEFVPGQTLEERIGSRGLPLRETLKFGIQIADALDKAHGAGIIHRDLKPNNVMVTPDGLVKVLDFGVAKLTEPPAIDDIATTRTRAAVATDEGTILGTASYMSPEQAEGKTLDARSDIFSFGALLYEMSSGRRAFAGESRASTLAMILREDPRPLSDVVKNVPVDLEKIVRRCLRKDPARRFHHMIDVKVALEDLKEDSESGPATPVVSGSRTHRSRWLAGGGAVVLAALVAAYAFLGRKPTAAVAPPATIAPLTSYSGVEKDPTFSPDGSQVAFSWAGADQSNLDIYVKLVGPGDPLRLTTDPGVDLSPAWSPDGRWIAFVRLLPGARAGFFLVPALGGPERKVGETFSEQFLDSLPAPLIAWSPDSKWLFVPDKEKAQGDFGLFLLSIATGEKKRLTTPLPGGADSGAALSPDGRTLAFVRQRGWGVTNIALLPVATDASGAPSPQGEPLLLRPAEPDNRNPAWTSDGKEIVFSSGVFRSATNLWRVAATLSAQPSRLSIGGADGFSVAIWRPDVTSRRTARLVYSQMAYDIDVWRVELTSRGTRAAAPVRLISSSRRDFTALYSPNGQRIGFFSDRSGRAEIWVANADGSGVYQLTTRGVSTAAPILWSPDSDTIVFNSAENGQDQPFVVRAAGGEPRSLGSGLGGRIPIGLSPDGESVFLLSLDAAPTKPTFTKVAIRGGPEVEATPSEIIRAPGRKIVQSDGSMVFVASGNEPTSLWQVPATSLRPDMSLLVAPASLTGARQIVPALFHPQNYVVADQGVYFMSRLAQGPLVNTTGLIQFYRFATSAIEDVATLDRAPFFGLDISPDGRYLLYSQIERLDGDLMLIDNFR